jgi:hypothetical protein
MQIILYAATWFINILFWAGFIPQIILNFRLKTTKGISDLMLLAFFNGYITYNYYVFCCDLPMAYKILSPISLVTVIVMLVQRFMYDKNSKKLFMIYVANSILAMLFIPYALSKTLLVGDIMGWISAMIWFVFPVPQIVKIFMDRSVVGFSFMLVTLVGFGDILNSIIAIALQLPTQTLFNGLRGILVYLIFCLQFFLFRRVKEVRYQGAVTGYDPPKVEKDIERENSA